MASQIETCFITAPAGSNLEVLAGALRRRNIHIIAPQQLSAGAEIVSEISNVLRDVDLVIGVLTSERRSEWILFELGQAWALGKRILLFAPPNFAHLPSTLRRFLTVRANVSNREAVEFALDQLLAAPEPTRRPGAPPKEKPPLGASADGYLQGSLPMIASATPSELEALVADALREAGVDVLATSPRRDQGADLAIWSDALQPFVGNPLLVEIKAQLQGQRAVSNAAQQLGKYVAAAGGLWGLLLYGAGPGEPQSLPPNILALQIETLFRRLRDESFDDIVRELRNRRVHGVGI
jgi:hypothetical protein